MSISQDNNFGVVLACYPGDLWIAKACLASIKTFAPHLPIALIADKNPDLSEILPLYNIQYVIRKEDAQNPYLRDYCFGTRFTSAIALFESPFEKFIYLDADTLFWGDISPRVKTILESHDFIGNTPHEDYSDFILKTQYFDFERIFHEAPAFSWQGHHYFNSGVMAGRRNVLDLDLFIYLHKLWKKDPKLIFEIQGVVNFIVFYMKSKGTLRVGETLLQEVVAVRTTQDLQSEYAFEEGRPVVKKDVVLHYAGLKPMIKSYKGYLKPVVYFRMKHLKESGRMKKLLGTLSLLAEEYQSNLNTYYNGSLINYFKYKITGKK
ncbi:MAG: glycosyltransferase [Flavobacteriales bacterium]|nr:glycosyltransferase [Flavobacteriales bacterium]